MQDAIDALGRSAQYQARDLNAYLADVDARLGQQLAERMQQALAEPQSAWLAGVEATVQRLGAVVDEQREVLRRLTLSLDMTGLDRVLESVAAWRVLSDEQRTTAVSVVEDAYRSADAAAVSDAMVAELEGTARQFAEEGGIDYLPIEVSRQSFVLFVGTVVLLALMTLSFSNDTADEVMSKALEVGPAVGIAALAAGRAWDRSNGVRPNSDDDQDN
ncbi:MULTISPECIES: hypothetical protein [Streptomyces]|uniref:Uncharacterized protein n=1 Tax=Streptomyces lienomycini TaxID=284035 RepID=A0ABV9X788_9ACTN|nr:hypothetical protein [Streptomyces sp. NBC_00334]